jgi:hypothetical protein
MKFTWSHHENQKQFKSYFIENVQENWFRSILKIDNITETDGGSFECTIHNKLGEDKISIELLVQTAPKIEGILINGESRQENFEILEGKSLSIECVVDGFPEPNILWTKNDEKFADEAMVDLSSVSIDDDGVYECISENSLGTSNRNLRVIVNYPPRIKRSIVTDLEVNEGGHVALDCNLIGSPKPTFTWLKNSRNLTDDNENYEFSQDDKILSFYAHADDNGIYKCIGVNNHGQSFIEFTVTILGSEVSLSSPSYFH